MKYYYITWQSQQSLDSGAMILNFHDDFNLYEASTFIQSNENEGAVVIITGWKEVTFEQYKQYEKYVNEALNPKPKNVLTLVKQDE